MLKQCKKRVNPRNNCSGKLALIRTFLPVITALQDAMRVSITGWPGSAFLERTPLIIYRGCSLLKIFYGSYIFTYYIYLLMLYAAHFTFAETGWHRACDISRIQRICRRLAILENSKHLVSTYRISLALLIRSLKSALVMLNLKGSFNLRV